MPEPLLIAVMGETASGKTALAESLAEDLGAQLINADSFQVYRGMDIGTAKSDLKDRYRLMDLKDPDEPFGVGEWVQLAAKELQSLHKQGMSAVVVGGSGLNIRALFEQYDTMAGPPDQELRDQLNERHRQEGLQSLVQQLKRLDEKAADTTDLNNPIRVIRALERAVSRTEKIHFELPPFRQVKFAIRNPVSLINQRIDARAREMTDNGWLEEVAMLRDAGYGPNAPGFRAHGYRELWRVLSGEMNLEEALESIVSQVRRYAKRQRTWLRAEPNLTVLDVEEDAPLSQARMKLFALGEGG